MKRTIHGLIMREAASTGKAKEAATDLTEVAYSVHLNHTGVPYFLPASTPYTEQRIGMFSIVHDGKKLLRVRMSRVKPDSLGAEDGE